MRRILNPDALPKPLGAYSQVVRANDMIFLAGMVPFDKTGRVVGTDIAAQTRQALENLAASLEAIGSSLDDVCTVTAFLSNLDRDFAGFNEVYAEFFPSAPPARTTVSSGLFGFLVELQAIAVAST